MKTGISSGDAILANPDGGSYETAWERMMQDMRDRSDVEKNPPLDCLGRKRKDYHPAVDDLLGDDDDWDKQDEEDLRQWQRDMGLLGDETVPVKTNDNDKEESIIVFRDTTLDFPELNLNVAVLGPPEDTRGFPAFFSRAACTKADSIQDADLVVFTGGPDVDPCYYSDPKKHPPHPSIFSYDERDFADLAAYMTCMEEGIPMLGVCRGAQFLAVMNQFKLVQDLDNHQKEHSIFIVGESRQIDRVSSQHHQSVIPGPGMDVLAYSNVSSVKYLDADTKLEKVKLGLTQYPHDIEAFFIRETCCIGVQGHPEYKGYHAFAKYVLDLLNEYIILNEDIEWEGNRRRMKNEFKEEARIRRDAERAAEYEIMTVKEK